MKLIKLIANLGYGSRKEVLTMARAGRITDASGATAEQDAQLEHCDIRIDGLPLDPPTGLLIMLHKPIGYVCSRQDPGRIVYDLLPPRFAHRSPVLATVGRLDRDTSGLLLLTDDGKLLHRIAHPKIKLPKTYEALLARDLRGDEANIFASGKLLLNSETKSLAPAKLEVISLRQVKLTIVEGRYHQVRRMFAAVGNHVEALHRSRIGGLTLGDLPLGAWRAVDQAELQALFAAN